MGHDEIFAGLPIVVFSGDSELANPKEHAIKLMQSWDGDVSFVDAFLALLEEPKAKDIEVLVIGTWSEAPHDKSSELVIDLLVAAKEKLPNLRALFIGDIASEEKELAWIVQSDFKPLFTAYPQLEVLKLRGSYGLLLDGLELANNLHTLIIESAGLDRSVIEAITASPLANLQHLELWLGSEESGANINIYDFEVLLSDEVLPSLKYLGLRNSEHADELAPVVASSPLLLRLDSLDMSLGNMSDQGGEAFLKSSALGKLKTLNLQYHYFSDDMMQRLSALSPEVDTSRQKIAQEWDGELHREIFIAE